MPQGVRRTVHAVQGTIFPIILNRTCVEIKILTPRFL
jgi:hypothetical protein